MFLQQLALSPGAMKSGLEECGKSAHRPKMAINNHHSDGNHNYANGILSHPIRLGNMGFSIIANGKILNIPKSFHTHGGLYSADIYGNLFNTEKIRGLVK